THSHLRIICWMKRSHPKESSSQLFSMPIRVTAQIQNVGYDTSSEAKRRYCSRQKWRRRHNDGCTIQNPTTPTRIVRHKLGHRPTPQNHHYTLSKPPTKPTGHIFYDKAWSPKHL